MFSFNGEFARITRASVIEVVNDALDKAMNDALAAGTEAEAKTLWETAQDLIRADMPTVPVANSKPQAAATIDLKGFIGSAALNEPLNLVWLDRP